MTGCHDLVPYSRWRQLLGCCPDGVFKQDATFAYELAPRVTLPGLGDGSLITG